jgi:hypothetical protein
MDDNSQQTETVPSAALPAISNSLSKSNASYQIK